MFQHTAARRRLLEWEDNLKFVLVVSTHSRAEAAAGFPPKCRAPLLLFQHTAARRRLLSITRQKLRSLRVSTHSRAEAAASSLGDGIKIYEVSTHSRAEAAAPYIKKQEKSAY